MPKRLPLHTLDQSGATDGDTAVWSETEGAWVPATAGGSGATTALVPMSTKVGAGDPQLVFTPAGEVLMMEVVR